MEEAKVDLSLVRTYRPVLILVSGTLFLLFLHHGFDFFLLSEKYILVSCVLYVFSELVPEQIFDSGTALAYIASTFLVQDLRLQHTFSQTTPVLGITNSYILYTVLTVWVSLNGTAILFVNKLYELNHTLHHDCKAMLIPYQVQAQEQICYMTRSRILSLVLLTSNAFCFLLISTSVYNDERTISEENVKIWSFVFLCVIWIYKVDYKYLCYTNIYSFHHCLVRYSSLPLFTNFEAFIVAALFLLFCTLYRTFYSCSETKQHIAKPQIQTQEQQSEYAHDDLEQLLKESMSSGQYSKFSKD